MTNQVKKYVIAMILAIFAMFLWIFVAVWLTGGRDVPDFTETDKVIMGVFIVVELVTMALTLLLAFFVGHAQGKQRQQQIQSDAANVDKTARRRGSLLWVLAFFLAFGVQIGGIVLQKGLSPRLRELGGWLIGGSIAAAALCLLINLLLENRYLARFNKQQVSQINQFLYSHRDRAEETAARKLALLQLCIGLADAYAVLLGVLGLSVALCSGISYTSGSAVPLQFCATVLLMAAFSRIRFPVSQKVFEENKSYISQEQYPQLYAVAQKAAQTIGCPGKIRIALLPDCNAGIAKLGKSYSVQLGVMLLCTLSEEELYCILLHEFAHVTEHNDQVNRVRRYGDWVRFGKLPHYASAITNLFYAFFDTFYQMQFTLYSYASSILLESAADRAMLLGGNPEAAGSALLKLKYYELFSWEKDTRDTPSEPMPEAPEPDLIARELEEFHQAMAQRGEDWQHLLHVEIQSRAATHPTLKLRLEALGIREPRALPVQADSEFGKDCRKALAYVDAMICEDRAEGYQAFRKECYLEPKETVEKWEADGKPLVPEEYAEIIWALRQLGRVTEAIALCDRAIGELPDAAACCGYFIRGCHRLHCYDPAGIADIYFAIEHNNNYFQEGIDAIGAFCCLTGNQEELDVYREKATVLAQEQVDIYGQVGVLNKQDRLSEESLPQGMLEGILAYIRSVDEGQIDKVYLVRKTITENFFTSVFVVRFAPEAPEEECQKILSKIFNHLDTCSDWQFSLFDYQDVMGVPVHKIPNSCVYSRQAP